MSKVSCEIIKDILPLYYDGVCSDDSKRMIEEHLVECEYCKLELEKIQANFKLPKEEIEKSRNDRNVIKNISTFWNRSRLISFLKGIIISALFFLVIFLVDYGLFQWSIVNVPTDVIEVTKVSQLTDGKIAVELTSQDELIWNEIKYEIDEDGNLYITPLRTIIQKQPQQSFLETLIFDIESEDMSYEAIYYGTQEDNELIWKKGMNLPKASEEIESMY